jgi:hypothetical protein
MLLIVWFHWIGSAVSGFLHQFWWLILPPVFFSIFILGGNWNIQRKLRSDGLSKSNFFTQMIRQSVVTIIWNTSLNSMVFGIFWTLSGIRKLFS